MRFNNDDYLKAFPREERATVPAADQKTIVKDEPGSVFDDVDQGSNDLDQGSDDTGAAGTETDAEGGVNIGNE